MERIRVWAVGDRLYPHPSGHDRGVKCRFVGRAHVRVEITPKPDLARNPHADLHRAEFPALPEGEELFVGSVLDGADILPADFYRALIHGDLTDKDPRPAPIVTMEPAPSEPAPASDPSAPKVVVTDAQMVGEAIKRVEPAPASTTTAATSAPHAE